MKKELTQVQRGGGAVGRRPFRPSLKPTPLSTIIGKSERKNKYF